MDSAQKYNLRNPAVKRILQEMKEMQEDRSQEFVAEALEENIFEWQFVICGPVDTEFEGGLYHGRIILPTEYPFKPPSFVMLTPSGRFDIGKKICLSISERHPEHWQPSWSMRTALMALVAFLPTKGKGAIGSLDFPADERKKLAQISRTFIPNFGNEERQAIAKRIHAEALYREKKGDMNEGNTEIAEESNEVEEAETIKSATNVRSCQSNQGSSCSEITAESVVSDEAPESQNYNGLQGISSQLSNITDISGIPSHLRKHTTNELSDAGDKEWAWSAAMWAIGILILAIFTRKVLVRAGVDIWSFIGL